MMLKICVVVFCILSALAVISAAPSRSQFHALLHEKQEEATLALHRSHPFKTKAELAQLPQDELINLILAMSGGDPVSNALPSHLEERLDVDFGWPPVWPHPQQFTNGTENITISPSLTFDLNTPSADLTAAFARVIARIFTHSSAQGAKNPQISSVSVSVTNPNAEVQLETDESYTLSIALDGTTSISAKTQVGVLHALETLSQLVLFDFDTETYVIQGVPWEITDAPRFKHREILIDTSRHFLPVPTIKQIIDSLTYAKLNVLHWHIVDSPSFPLDSPTYPKLGRLGSYSPQERYSIADVKDVIEYARQRGVRVMGEIDMPGHAGSWCAGHPEICPATDCLEPLNPSTDATFDLVEGLLGDLTGGGRGKGVFFENFLHLGGDEVNTNCWNKSESIRSWMTANNYTLDTAYYYFVGRVQEIAKSQGRDPVGWEEIWNYFGTKLDKSTIIHQWLPGSTVAEHCVKEGYRVLWSTDGVWYLDGLSVTWETMYKQEPCTNISDANCSQYVLGGGGEMWGETADTSDVLQTIWPRAAAVAERLWSPRDITDEDSARPRMAAFRCLLNRRGVAAAPTTNSVARSAPSGPGSCYAQ